MSTEQAARILGLHPETVREHLRAGRIKSTRIGRVYLIEERDLRAFAAKPRPKPGRPRKEPSK